MMAPLADFLLRHLSISLPTHLSSYVPGQTPLSTTRSVAVSLISYLIVIFSIQAFMKDKKPQKLNTLFQAHNCFLSTGSLILLVLILEGILPLAWKNGFFSAICDEESWTEVSLFYYESQLLPIASTRTWSCTT
jgi:fatty acid elongase 3